MKNFSRRLKKTAPLLLLGLLFNQSPVSQKAQALVGGPFDDSGFAGVNADGTYSGTVSGHNLIGIVTFGVSSSSETNGRFSIFHEGFVHYGAATGIADVQARRVAGSLLGVAALGGSGLPQAVNGLNVVSVTETTGGSGSLSSGSIQALTVRTGLEGSFMAEMKGYPQRIRFEGKGRLSTNANTAVVTTPADNPGYTVFFGSNSSPEQQTDIEDDDNPNAKIAASGGNISVDANAQRAILRSQTPFKIRGARTSRQVYAAVNSYTAAPPPPALQLQTTGGTPSGTPAPTPQP